MHEPDQRLDREIGTGAAMREGQLICPRHGSMFDAETGYCDNGDAKGRRSWRWISGSRTARCSSPTRG